MDLNRIKYFQAVALTKNISKACSLVHLSQPALSLQIQALESDLGIKLFERNNRGLILTEEGVKLHERASILLDWERETLDIINDLNVPSGQLRIGTYTTASSYLLSPILNEFLQRYKDINISYDYSPTDQILEKIKTLELDCAVVSEVPDDKGIESVPFYHCELILVASARMKMPNKLKPSELSKYPFLSYPLRLDYCYQEVERKLGKYLKRAPARIESESFDTLKQSLLAELGITFMPRYLVHKELEQGLLKELEVSNLTLPITFSFVQKKYRILPKKVQAFKEHLTSSFQK